MVHLLCLNKAIIKIIIIITIIQLYFRPQWVYFVFCFGITYDCVKRVQASNNTLLDKPVDGVACPSNVDSEAPNMRIDIQKRNMQHPSFSESELELIGVNRPAFGGTVPHFHQMSRGPAKSADDPHFSKMVLLFFPLTIRPYSTCLPRNATK